MSNAQLGQEPAAEVTASSQPPLLPAAILLTWSSITVYPSSPVSIRWDSWMTLGDSSLCYILFCHSSAVSGGALLSSLNDSHRHLGPR